MCGIAGFLQRTAEVDEPLEQLAQTMADTLTHRGPDDSGAWADSAAGIALGHRRLSIMDLSAAGHQPMLSANGRFVVSYNGEIYNHVDLRKELESQGAAFRGHSDTEVIVEGFARWGIPKTLSRLIGMFALAVWDREARSLTLIRDRLGIKPLYWGQFGGTFVFGSELRAIRSHPRAVTSINRAAVVDLVRHGYVTGGHSIYNEVQRVPPGSMLTISAEGKSAASRYWTVQATRTRIPSRRPEAVRERIEALLSDAVKRRMVADVPLGAFLSGGVGLVCRHRPHASAKQYVPSKPSQLGSGSKTMTRRRMRARSAPASAQITPKFGLTLTRGPHSFLGCRKCTTSLLRIHHRSRRFLVSQVARRDVNRGIVR